jgi:AraC-like DNA-binding protein
MFRYLKEETTLQYLPRLPLLSSYQLNWEGIYVSYHRQPSWQIPEHSTRKNQEPLERDLHSAIAYINDRLEEDLSLKKIAQVAKISPYYFARLFKQATGMTLNQYVTSRRMEKAKHLLLKQDLSVVEVAKQVGIKSQSHFNKVFRKHTGSTPKAYRDK